MKQPKKKNQLSHKQRVKSAKSWQSMILRRVLARVRPTLSDPLSLHDADAVRAALAGTSENNNQC